MIVVTAAVIKNRDNKILICQRKPDSHNGLKWEFPGGKLEEQETPEQCLRREIKEELDVDIEVGEIFKVVKQDYSDRVILLLAYECNYISGELKTIDCNDYKWVKKSEIKKYDIALADIPIVEKLVK
jgi:8-oxo-dGTP diphosphatase